MWQTIYILLDFPGLTSFRTVRLCNMRKVLWCFSRQHWWEAGTACAPCHKEKAEAPLHSGSSTIYFGNKDGFHLWNLFYLHWVIYLQYSLDNLLKVLKAGVNPWVLWHKNDWKTFNYAIWNSLHSKSLLTISTVEIPSSEISILKCRI